MESASGVNLPSDGRMTAFSISTSYNIATDHLKTNVCSFIWANKKYNHENWGVGTWSVRTRRSFITKHGNETDIAKVISANKIQSTTRKEKNDPKISKEIKIFAGIYQ